NAQTRTHRQPYGRRRRGQERCARRLQYRNSCRCGAERFDVVVGGIRGNPGDFQQVLDAFVDEVSVNALQQLFHFRDGRLVPRGRHDVHVHGPGAIRIPVHFSVLIRHLKRNRSLDPRKHLDRPADGEVADEAQNDADCDADGHLRAASHPMSPLSFEQSGPAPEAPTRAGADWKNTDMTPRRRRRWSSGPGTNNLQRPEKIRTNVPALPRKNSVFDGASAAGVTSRPALALLAGATSILDFQIPPPVPPVDFVPTAQRTFALFHSGTLGTMTLGKGGKM